MATEKAADDAEAGSDIIAMALEHLGGKPVDAEQEVEGSEEVLSQDETEEAEPEVKAEDEAEDDSEGEDEAEEDADKEEKSPDKVQKRIDKLTAQKKAASEEAAAVKSQFEEAQKRIEELEAQVNEAARPVLQASQDNPLADVDNEDALSQRVKSAQQVRRWALENADGATITKNDGTEVYLDSDQVKMHLLRADDLLTIHAPAKQQWLAQRAPAIEAAKAFFPDILKKGTPMNSAFLATIKQAPDLLKMPQAEYWVGLALYGEQQLMAKQKAEAAKVKAKEKVSSAKTPVPAKPVSSPKSVTKGAVSKTVRDRVMSGAGGISALEAYMNEALFSS